MISCYVAEPGDLVQLRSPRWLGVRDLVLAAASDPMYRNSGPETVRHWRQAEAGEASKPAASGARRWASWSSGTVRCIPGWRTRGSGRRAVPSRGAAGPRPTPEPSPRSTGRRVRRWASRPLPGMTRAPRMRGHPSMGRRTAGAWGSSRRTSGDGLRRRATSWWSPVAAPPDDISTWLDTDPRQPPFLQRTRTILSDRSEPAPFPSLQPVGSRNGTHPRHGFRAAGGTSRQGARSTSSADCRQGTSSSSSSRTWTSPTGPQGQDRPATAPRVLRSADR